MKTSGTDSVKLFVAEKVKTGGEGKISLASIYPCFLAFCRDRSIHAGPRIAFARMITQALPDVKITSHEGWRYFHGVGVTP